MSKKIGRNTYTLDKPIYVIGRANKTSQKEADGPLGKYFDDVANDDTLGEETFEKAERRLMEETVFHAISNANKKEEEIDLFIGGDLLNQLVTTNYTARSYNIPFLGVYGACSTMSESLIIASLILDGGGVNNIVCATGSHFSASERQFRNPLELGCQRQTYSQWTVTGMGAVVLSNVQRSRAKITQVSVGNVTDFGVVDIANMGAAMAPAIAIIGLCGMILPRISNTKIYSKGGKYSINNVCEIQLGSQQNILLTFYYRIKIQII